jgi:hypothetical protein
MARSIWRTRNWAAGRRTYWWSSPGPTRTWTTRGWSRRWRGSCAGWRRSAGSSCTTTGASACRILFPMVPRRPWTSRSTISARSWTKPAAGGPCWRATWPAARLPWCSRRPIPGGSSRSSSWAGMPGSGQTPVTRRAGGVERDRDPASRVVGGRGEHYSSRHAERGADPDVRVVVQRYPDHQSAGLPANRHHATANTRPRTTARSGQTSTSAIRPHCILTQDHWLVLACDLREQLTVRRTRRTAVRRGLWLRTA